MTDTIIENKLAGNKKKGRGSGQHIGRQKGTPNKPKFDIFLTLKREISERTNGEIADYDPLVELAILAFSTVDQTIRLRANAIIAEYVHYKKRALDITGDLAIQNNNQNIHVFCWSDERIRLDQTQVVQIEQPKQQ